MQRNESLKMSFEISENNCLVFDNEWQLVKALHQILPVADASHSP